MATVEMYTNMIFPTSNKFVKDKKRLTGKIALLKKLVSNRSITQQFNCVAIR